jgi:hypothetical protein
MEQQYSAVIKIQSGVSMKTPELYEVYTVGHSCRKGNVFFKTKGKVCLKLRAMIVAKFEADFSFKT